ncbi:MAG: hypothetical protein JWR19_432 [Pedosphaera sp.]|nr:hypothetical protein [Pedosphaera sp.]
MKSRFILFKRAGVYYSEDTKTGKQHGQRTNDEEDEAEALTILHSKDEAHRQLVLNLQIARTYLMTTDPEVAKSSVSTMPIQSASVVNFPSLLTVRTNVSEGRLVTVQTLWTLCLKSVRQHGVLHCADVSVWIRWARFGKLEESPQPWGQIFSSTPGIASSS